MNLSPMRYRNYVWPHNPRVYTIEYRRVMAVNKVPFDQYQLQDLGRSNRIMKGEGEFVGENAYSQFGQLANTFYEEGPGLLVHPLWQAASAYFVSLKVEQAPRPDYVRYSFEFWEGSGPVNGLAASREAAASASRSAGEERRYHRVAEGDTLWALAKRYGLSLAELTALNPQIKNPNLIRVGEEVRVR